MVREAMDHEDTDRPTDERRLMTLRRDQDSSLGRTQGNGIVSHGLEAARMNDLWGRIGLIGAAAFSFSAGLKVYQAAGVWPPSIPVGLALYVTALICLGAAIVVTQPVGRSAQRMVAGAVLLALVAWASYEIEIGNPVYGTDGIAFAHVGAETVLSGQNPYAYAEDLAPIFERFGVPEFFVTRTSDGQSIQQLISYPGGHVLAYTAALAFGVDDLRWATLAFELIALAAIWAALSPPARFVAPLVLLAEPNLVIYFTSGGLTDWLWVLPLVFTAVSLHRERPGYAGIFLGLACAVKQQPWFVVPFVLIWVLKKTSGTADKELRRKDRGSFIAGLIGGFIVPNLPFIVWGADDWLRGVLAPGLESLVPDGQGLAVLASRGVLPLSQMAYTAALLIGIAVSVAVYWRAFPRVQDLLWVFPPALLLLSHRSFHNYFIYWIPIIVLWLVLRSSDRGQSTQETSQRSATAKTSSRWSLLLLIAPLSLMGAGLWAGESLVIGSVRPVVDSGLVTALDIDVRNVSATVAEPVFEVYWGGWPVPWRLESPTSIAPQETMTVRILPTGPETIPPAANTTGGRTETKPFRVRVNAKGATVYGTSDVIQLPPTMSPTVNPYLDVWGKPEALERAPFGWTTVRQTMGSASVSLVPLENGRGMRSLIESSPSAGGEWAEAALYQSVSSLQQCYVVSLLFWGDYVADSSGSPVRAVGLQVLQNDASLWFVASNVKRSKVNDRPDGTRIVETPLSEGVWGELVLDLGPHVDRVGMQLGAGATIKVFNALHQSQAGHQELRIKRITAKDC